MGIKKIIPSQILNSNGEPTLKVRMISENGKSASFSVPGGASLGKDEAVKKFDNAASYAGKSVNGNVETINKVIAPKFIGYPLGHQEDFDSLIIALDGSQNKENLGSNTILALSGAYFKLSAKLSDKPLWQYIAELLKFSPEFPRIYANLVGGGKHAPGLDIQEFMIVPATNKPNQAIEQIAQTYQTVKTIMTSLYGPTARLSGDEGAIAPVGARTEVVLEALSNLNQKSENKFDIALDVAANSFFDGKDYNFEGQMIHASDLMTVYQGWATKFGLYSIEDPFAETDTEGLELLKTIPKEKKSFMVIGDDFTVTNAIKINEFAQNKMIDGVIIKPDQVGSITEMFNAVQAAKASGLKVIVSHRSGETNDDFIADLAFGIGADGIKIGAPNRGERIAKYNRLLDIENSLNPDAQNTTNEPSQSIQPVAPVRTEPIQANPAPPIPKPILNPATSSQHTAERPTQARDVHFGVQSSSSARVSDDATNHNENPKGLDNAVLTPKEALDINNVRVTPPTDPIPMVPQDNQGLIIPSGQNVQQNTNSSTAAPNQPNNTPKPSLSV